MSQHRPREPLDVAMRELSTWRLPMTGEMCIRCMDEQFWRYESRAPSIAILSRSWSMTSSTGAAARPARLAADRSRRR
jgi:hypothetical protein